MTIPRLPALHTGSGMLRPPLDPPPPLPEDGAFNYSVRPGVTSPATAVSELPVLLRTGKMNAATMVWWEGMEEWRSYSDCMALILSPSSPSWLAAVAVRDASSQMDVLDHLGALPARGSGAAPLPATVAVTRHPDPRVPDLMPGDDEGDTAAAAAENESG